MWSVLMFNLVHFRQLWVKEMIKHWIKYYLYRKPFTWEPKFSVWRIHTG